MADNQESTVDPPPRKKQKPNDPSNETKSVSVQEVTVDELFINDDKYKNIVPLEEVAKLKEFKVLDEAKTSDEDSDEDNNSDSDDANMDGDANADVDGKSEDLPDEEIEKMLEEDLPESFKTIPKPKEKTYIKKQKIILEEKSLNKFEVLPLDWIMVRHCSGIPLYMHRTTRVCTLSKPFFIGTYNIRRYEIPLSAIPCFAYRKALDEEEKQEKIKKKIEEQISNGTWANNLKTNDQLDNVDGGSVPQSGTLKAETVSDEIPECKTEVNEPSTNKNAIQCPYSGQSDEKPDHTLDIEKQSENKIEGEIPINIQPVVLPGGKVMPPPRVETVNAQHLSHEEVTDYCKKLFKFKICNTMQFKRWVDRRKYTKIRKTLQIPNLPEGTKLITIPAQPSNKPDSGGKANKRDWVMNMNDRSSLSVFHEYVRRVLQDQPVYEFEQLQNSSSPYRATVFIGGMQYGMGYGSSKRQAKSAAARASIHILIPEMKEDLDKNQSAQPQKSKENDFTFFDHVSIEDPRVMEFCSTTCEPSPHAVLRTCLLRNFGAGDRHIRTEIKKLEYQKIELTMKVGKHTSTVVCKNKKLGKQLAAQHVLQALHPHVRSWGSLLRLYGSRSLKSCKERKLDEQQITLLQDKARHNEPNYAVLKKLRDEMLKLRARDDAVQPIGTLMVADDLPTHSGSNLNNVDL